MIDQNDNNTKDYLGNTLPLAISTLASSPTNPRKHFDEAKLGELTESIKQQGVLQAILVRPWPQEYSHSGDRPLYEIIAGERRYRAAQAAGLEMIPATILQIATPKVLEIQVIENLQREGLHELDEAEGYEAMMNHHGYSAVQVAEKIGKSRSYVFGRLKLLALDEWSRDQFRQGNLSASTALLVARIPSIEMRKEAVKEITAKDALTDNPMSFRKAQDFITRNYMRFVSSFPFDWKLDSFSMGSCKDCPKRSENIPAWRNEFSSANVCTDSSCFSAKRQEYLDSQIKSLSEQGKTVIAGESAFNMAAGRNLNHVTLPGYERLDNTCYRDPERRTFRQILGDDPQSVFVENHAEKNIVEMVKSDIVIQKLKDIGIIKEELQSGGAVTTYKHDAIKGLSKQKYEGNPPEITQEEIAKEEARRKAIFECLLQKNSAEGMPEAAMLFHLRNEITEYVDIYTDDEKSTYILNTVGIFGQQYNLITGEEADINDVFVERINTATLVQCWQILIINSCENFEKLNASRFTSGAHYLNSLAEIYGFDPDNPIYTPPPAVAEDKPAEAGEESIKGDGELEQDASSIGGISVPVSTKKQKKGKAKNSGPAKAEPNETSTAAQPKLKKSKAAKTVVINENPKVAYVHPTDSTLSWSGKGRRPIWVQKWVADGGTLKELKS